MINNRKNPNSWIFITFCFLLLTTFSCTQQQNQKSQNTFAPKITEAKGCVIPKDSMKLPTVIPVDESKLSKIPVGNPKVIPTNTNIHIAGIPKIILAGTPRVCTSGIDTFLLPKIKPAKDSSFVAGIPEVVVAKDAYTKESNPQNFSSFSKLQGLKHDIIRCMLQDKSGNLWLGTYGGVCKYDGKFFTNFTKKEGLNNNTVLSILQDKSGNLWFGTSGGVSKYDGKFFTNFTKKEGLSNNGVLSILQDKSGNLWFGTDGDGVSKYDGKFFTNFTKKEGLSNNNVYSILQDKTGNLWFGTSVGVSKYDGKSFTNFTEKEGLSNNNVYSILQDKSGNLWFGTDGGGVSKYDGKYFTIFTEKEGLNNNHIRCILQDKSGYFWFGTYGGGVSKYDGKYFIHFTEKEGLSNNRIYNILQDKSRTLWFGTYGGGVSKYDGKSFTNFTEKEGLSNNRIRSILQDKSGNLWFGTYGGGVSKYDGKSFTNFTEKEGLSNNSVYSILQDKSENFWFGTDGGGVSKYNGEFFTHFTEKEGLSNNRIRCILQDKSGNLWFGTYGGGVSKYDGKSFTNFTEKEGLSNNNVYSILQDKSGNFWFGTDGGVSKYDGEFFTHFTKKEGLSNNSIYSILQDKSGNLWFGTDGGGVSKYDGKSFTYFTEKEGLSNNFVFSMLEDKSGNLWIGTRFGFCKLPQMLMAKLKEKIDNNKSGKGVGELAGPKQRSNVFFKYYGYEDGFLGIGINGGKTIYEDKNGTIWIGSTDRLIAYHHEGDDPDTIPPNIQLTSIELFNENIAWINLEHKKDSNLVLGNGVSVGNFEFDGLTRWYNLPEKLSLAYNNNYLTFNFIGITQKQSKKVKYQYKLEGIDENWSAITSRTEAPYGNLPQGSYIFKVKAMNSEGYWSNEFQYKFTIRPPWWKTWWFRTIYISAFILSLFIFYKWRVAKLEREKKILEEKVKIRTAQLSQANEEITAQRDEISAQRDLVTQQKEHIEEIHREVTDSINYAKRIQQAVLPDLSVIARAQPEAISATQSDCFAEARNDAQFESFILFKPKDVVSGDFYWATKINEFLIVTVADCTGHGVPGAFMSMLGISFLNEIVRKKEVTQASQVLDNLRESVIDALKQHGTTGEQKDGMDIVFCVINLTPINSPSPVTLSLSKGGEGTGERFEMQFAGANNPLYLIRSLSGVETPVIEEIKPDKMPVAIYENMKPFTNHVIQLQKDDIIYLASDGYEDQFGGPKHKKFLSKNMKNLLTANSQQPMAEQKELLEKALNDWKGDGEQIDDITVLGIRI